MKPDNGGEGYTSFRPLWSAVDDHGSNDATRIAIRGYDRLVTYESLSTMSRRLASSLSNVGAGNDPVLVLCGSEVVRAALLPTVLRAGKIYVPLDAAWPAGRLQRMLRELHPHVVLVDQESAALAVECIDDVGRLIGVDQRADEVTIDPAVERCSAGDLAWILFTSGSTGQPKGIMQTIRNACHYVRTVQEGLDIRAEDRIAVASSLTVHGGVVYTLAAFSAGATLYPIDFRRLGPQALADLLQMEQITVLFTVPTILRQLSAFLDRDQRLSSVRVVRLTGEAVTERDVDIVGAYFGEGCVLSVGLGATETGGICHAYFDRENPPRPGRPPVGYPVEGVQIRLLDAEGRDVGSNQQGEITVIGDYLSPGYWKQPELTEAAFSRMPDGRRMFRTGDLGVFRSDGALEHRGRKDLQVKIRGQRVEIEEIEAALLRFPFVRQAAVVARDDRGRDRLVAFVAVDSARTSVRQQLREGLLGVLPQVMVPGKILLLDALPQTVGGKVDRAALRAADTSGFETETPFVPPTTPIEKTLAGIWQEILGMERIGVFDNFLELGGDSLASTRIASRIRDVLGASLSVREMLHDLTIHDLASTVAAKRGDDNR